MANVKIFHDEEGQTLTVWLDDPEREHHCEELADDLIVMKDDQGRVIGFEQINYRSSRNEQIKGSAVEFNVG